jgi:hypothetical protein
MLATSFTTTTYTLWRPDNTQVPATPSYNAATNTATITPTLPLSYGTTYTVKLTTGVMDSASVPLPAAVSWTFTTTTTMVSKRIQVGATTAYTDIYGNSWLADVNFKNGLAQSFPTRTITNTTGYDPALFRDDRYGSTTAALWSYNIPIPNGTYDVKLYFVELTKIAIGQRVFSVDIVDTPGAVYDVTNLDIFKEVGANAGDVKTFTDVPIVDSTLTLKSYAVTDLPEIAAIELIPKHP